MKKRIWKYSETEELSKQIGRSKIVLVGGCFDLLHYGHFTFLQQAKMKGDMLIVALESDQFIQQKKKRNPVHNQVQRAEILTSLHFVDHVLLLPYFESDAEYGELVEKVKPAIIAVTEGDPNISYKQKHAQAHNAEVTIVSSLLPEFSTTQIMTNENISSS